VCFCSLPLSGLAFVMNVRRRKNENCLPTSQFNFLTKTRDVLYVQNEKHGGIASFPN